MKRFTVATVASCVLVVAAGCSTDSGTGAEAPAPSTALGAVPVPGGVPAAFQPKAGWVMPFRPGTDPLLTPTGTAMFYNGKWDRAGTVRVRVVAQQNGRPLLSSIPVPVGERPRLHSFSDGGHPFLLVTSAGPSPGSVRVATFDGFGAGVDVEPLASKTFVPEKDTTGGVQVSVSDSGVLVTGAQDPGPVLRWHPTGDVTVLEGLPRKDGAAPEVVSVRGDDAVVRWPGVGFGVRSASGSWDSGAKHPPGVAPDSGRLISVTGGYGVAAWTTAKDGEGVMSLLRLSTGRTVATWRGAPPSGNESPVVVDPSGGVAAWQDVVVDLRAGKARRVHVNGARAVAISRGVVYARGASKPLPGQTMGAGGAVAFDAATGSPVGAAVPRSPMAADTVSNGLFVAGAKVYAVPVS